MERRTERTKEPGNGRSRQATERIILTLMLLMNMPVNAQAKPELPVANGVVTSGVGWRVDPFGSGKLVFHRGIDIAVPVGTAVRAIRKGRVVFAGDHRGYGATVILEHANGERTLYGHNAGIRVVLGELIEAGTVVALSGNSGRSTGPHVHFEQLPSGRPIVEPAEAEEISVPRQASSTDQRYLLEQKMDESVNSILRNLNRVSLAGQGG